MPQGGQGFRCKCPQHPSAGSAGLGELARIFPTFSIAHGTTMSHWFLAPGQDFQHPHVQISAHTAAKCRGKLLWATKGQISGSGCCFPASCAHTGMQGCGEPLRPPKPKSVFPEHIWLQDSSCPGSGLPCSCHKVPILFSLQASLMACRGAVSDGGTSAHISEEKPHHTGFSPSSLEQRAL